MRIFFRLWLLPLLFVAALVALLQGFRLHRITQLSALPTWSVDAPRPDVTSPTGYADGWRQQLVTDPTGQSQQWIAQTQTLLHERHWRLHHVDYDNAPAGRATHLSLLYRWWLAGLALFETTFVGKDAGLAVEHVALYADLLLQALLLSTTVWFIARHFGRFAATLAGVALLTLHPLATQFVPGAPHSQGLAELAVLWSLLPLAAGLRESAPDSRRLFFVAGLAGGLGLSLNLATHLAVLGGIVSGALFVRHAAPWRAWGFGGALASLAIYAADNFPDHLSFRLEGNHPLYAIGWLALGVLLEGLRPWLRVPRIPPSLRELITCIAALITVAGTGALLLWQDPPILAADITLTQLNRLQNGFAGANLAKWLGSDGGSLRAWATLLPLALLGGGLAATLRDRTSSRSALRFLLGPLLVTTALACGWLRGWNTVDAIAVVALAAALDGRRASDRFGWIAGTAATALLGLLVLIPPRTTFRDEDFSPAEMQALMERDLAHWIARRRPDAIMLAPPALTTSLWYYGGTRGITTFDAANREGLMGALRIAGAPTVSEAQVLLAGRQATTIVLPAWDRGLDESARVVSGSTKSLFIEQLRNWILPGWTRPIAYYLPPIPGFSANPVVVFDIVDEQSEALFTSALATYFMESGLPGHAQELSRFVRRFPTDVGAVVSRAEIGRVTENEAETTAALAALEPLLAGRADRNLPWERRIALATVLTQAGRAELARPQAVRCFAEADEAQLRALSPKTLFRLLALGRTFDLTLPDPKLETLARSLLPPDFRAQLHPALAK